MTKHLIGHDGRTPLSASAGHRAATTAASSASSCATAPAPRTLIGASVRAGSVAFGWGGGGAWRHA
eukprot:6970528-Alexandrium_andersonii.AAC.1